MKRIILTEDYDKIEDRINNKDIQLEELSKEYILLLDTYKLSLRVTDPLINKTRKNIQNLEYTNKELRKHNLNAITELEKSKVSAKAFMYVSIGFCVVSIGQLILTFIQ